MPTRDKGRITTARKRLGERALLAFLRWAAGMKDILACQLMQRDLDEGGTLDSVFAAKGPWGYLLDAEKTDEDEYRITFGCLAGPDAGDGGVWIVTFDRAGHVVAGSLIEGWLC